jgi:hypothetical protein
MKVTMPVTADLVIALDDDPAMPLVAAGDIAPGATLDLGDLPDIPPVQRPDRSQWTACLMAATALHVAMLAFFNWPTTLTVIGGGGTELQAISIDMVSGAAFETRYNAAAAPAAATQLAPREGAEVEQQATMSAPDNKAPTKPDTPTPAAILVIPDIKPEPAPPDVVIWPVAPARV